MTDWRHDNYFGPNEFTNMKKEYTKKQVDEMREALASRSIDYWDEETIYDIAMDGCIGYKNMPDKDIAENWENVYGEWED